MAQYTTSIISYFDILGFKALVNNARDPEEVACKLRALRRHASTDEEVAAMNGSTFTNFSDLILRTVPVSSRAPTGGAGTLHWELNDLVHVQAELVRNRVLLRGAVTVGGIYVNDSITFGPGLIRAYELESTLALYPRVIVDPLVFDSLQQLPGLRHHTYNEELSYIKQIVTRDADGVWFVDYLRAFQSEVDEPEDYVDLSRESLGSHYDRTRRPQSPRQHCGEIWVVDDYHNRIVCRLDDAWLESVQTEKDSLLVETNTNVLPYLKPI